MKRKFRFDVIGDEAVAEWDSLFRADTVNLFGVAANPVGGTYSQGLRCSSSVAPTI